MDVNTPRLVCVFLTFALSWSSLPPASSPFTLRVLGADVTIPVLEGTDPSIYSAATTQAFVSIPRACVGTVGLKPNFADNDGALELWMSRFKDLPTDEDGQTGLEKCSCSWVILLHGSSGFTSGSLRSAARLAALGYGVFVPDSMAHSADLKLRHRAPAEDASTKTLTLAEYVAELEAAPPTASSSSASSASSSSAAASVYWSDDLVYGSECGSQGWNSAAPFCYNSSSSALFLSDPDGFASYYQRVFQLRKLELDYLVDLVFGSTSLSLRDPSTAILSLALSFLAPSSSSSSPFVVLAILVVVVVVRVGVGVPFEIESPVQKALPDGRV